MNLNIVIKNLKEKYHCQFIAIMNYADHDFVKGMESMEGGILYRYFKLLKDDELEEIKDELLLAYFKKMNETNDENNY